MRSLTALLFLAPGLALAQTTGGSIRLEYQTKTSLVVTTRDCDYSRSITWTAVLPSGGNPCGDPMKFWVTAGSSCASSGPGPGEEVATANLSTALTGSFAIPISELPIFEGSADGGTTACKDFVGEKDMKVCAQYKYLPLYSTSDCGTAVTSSTPVTLRFDNERPDAPTINEVVPLDGALSVTVTVADTTDTALVRLEYREKATATGDEGWTRGGVIGAGNYTGRITGLVNNTEYEVRAVAEDYVGLLSESSNIISETPIYTYGFWDRYRQAGGQETGGCTAAGGGALALGLVLLAGIRLTSRRKRS